MQDRFKFRVWEKDQKIMKECTQITLDKDQAGSMCDVKGKVTAHLVYQPHYILMQCTGLKDKNGKLIYEGDIVKRFHVSSTMQPSIFIGVVSYNDVRGYWKIEKNRRYEPFWDEDDTYEVLGNIYENPTLLIS